MIEKNYEYSAEYVADCWADWCGENTQWVKAMRTLHNLNCRVIWYGGYPQSASAMPLCFVIVKPDGSHFGHSRLKDMKAVINELQSLKT